jgi:hypothetical protein
LSGRQPNDRAERRLSERDLNPSFIADMKVEEKFNRPIAIFQAALCTVRPPMLSTVTPS